MSTDLTYIESLLNVAEKCTGHSNKLSSIQSWAISELIAINAEMKANAVAKAKAEAPAPAQPAGTAEVADEDDHSVDPDLGAPRAIPATELGSTNGRRL